MFRCPVAARRLASLGSSQPRSSGDSSGAGDGPQSPWGLALAQKDSLGGSSTTASSMAGTPRSSCTFDRSPSSASPSATPSLVFEASRCEASEDAVGIDTAGASAESHGREPDYESFPFISESWSELDVRPTTSDEVAGTWDPSMWDASTLCDAATNEPPTSAWR